jgi:hypothetical protein
VTTAIIKNCLTMTRQWGRLNARETVQRDQSRRRTVFQKKWKNRGIFPRKNTKSLALTTLSSVFLRSRSETGTTSDSRAKGKTGGSGTKLSQIPVPSR